MDEKVDNSGWRIKLVAECGYTHQLSDKVGARWSPSFPRQSLARRRARNIVQVHAHALNGSWECYHVMSSGLDWERFGVITGGDEVCILPPPTLS